MAELPNRTLGRGLAMLELLSQRPDGLKLYEIADALGLARSTAFNLARTLVELDSAWFDAQTNRYTLGLKMFEVGSASLHRLDIVAVIRNCMTEIYRQINETMHLGVRAEKDILYIDKIESTRSIRMISYMGSRAPLYCTALGKAILADLPDAQVRALYRRTTFTQFTEHTVATLPDLLRQLAQVRAQGYALERDEHDPGVCCVAVSLPAPQNHPQYAVSVSAPNFRMDDVDMDRYGRMLLVAKGKIARYARALDAGERSEGEPEKG